jgi:hypothetical protein
MWFQKMSQQFNATNPIGAVLSPTMITMNITEIFSFTSQCALHTHLLMFWIGYDQILFGMMHDFCKHTQQVQRNRMNMFDEMNVGFIICIQYV